MTRNLKALGLALLAVFALSAVAASAASAATDVFTSSVEKTDITGHSTNKSKFTAGGTPVKCETATYSGTTKSKEVSEVTVHPVYEGCIAAETFPATVDTHGCDYRLTGDTVEGHASAHIECTSGAIKITVFETAAHENLLMTISVPPQTVRGIAYDTKEDEAGHKYLTVTSTVEGEIESTCEGEFCFLVGGEGELEPASYDDDVTTTGWKDEGTFTRDETTHTWSGTHGAQVNITDHEVE